MWFSNQAHSLIYFETTKVTPIYKRGDPLECINYHPISLLSNVGKLTEILTHARLNMFLEEKNYLCENQFGFTKDHSTNHALINATEKF